MTLPGLIVAACQMSGQQSPCIIEPIPDPSVNLDFQLSAPRYSGITIHSTLGDSTGPADTFFSILSQCFVVRKSSFVPDNLKRLMPGSILIWFEIGSGSPWNPNGCQPVQ
jgi:hypothetical protein